MFPRFQVRYEGFLFYHLRKSLEGAGADLMFQFCFQLRGVPIWEVDGP